jgi:hypothetical protein
MRKIMIEAARAKHKLLKDETKFDPKSVDTSEVKDGQTYYRGWIFIPLQTIEMMSKNLLSTVSEVDAAHCSFGTLYRQYGYDANRHQVL